jgi:hypothetical protein
MMARTGPRLLASCLQSSDGEMSMRTGVRLLAFNLQMKKR